MIFYFSATGNSEYVAKRIASEINEETVSITDCVKNSTFSFAVKKSEKVGFVTPTYFLGLPVIVREFLEKLDLVIEGPHEPYVYHLATFGTTTGHANKMVENHIDRIGLSLNGRFCVPMPDTWTPVFNLSDKAKVEKINSKAEKHIKNVCKKVREEERGDFNRHKVPAPLARLYYSIYEKSRKTGNFTVEDGCIGCGLCEKICPVNAIELQDRKPVWVKDKCVLCFGCLHRCPRFSIQYGGKTQKHGQYVNPNVDR